MKNIPEILKMEDPSEMIIQIGQFLWIKAENDEKFEKNVLYIEMLETEINNGGFDQYFFNSSGEYAYETINALQEINAGKTADILNRAVQIFPFSPIPKDTETRREQMEDLPDEVSEQWEELDNEFYQYPDNLEELVLAYIRKHQDQF